jgi:biopolymer transport protein ExbD
MKDGIARYERIGKMERPVIIDAQPGVPWKDVIHVLDLCKVNGLEKVELAGVTPR